MAKTFKYYSKPQFAIHRFSHQSADINVRYVSAQMATANAVTHTVNALTIDLTPRSGELVVQGSVCFELGGETYYDKGGRLFYRLNPATGQGINAGSFNYQTGIATVTAWAAGVAPNLKLISLLTTPNKKPVAEVAFRVPAAPVAPQSLQLIGTDTAGNTFNVTADANGQLNAANLKGRIEVKTGVVSARFGQLVTAAGNESKPWYHADAVDSNGKIWQPTTVLLDTLRFNAVGYTYVPVDDSRLGIDTARLPSDGKVPIFRPGDTIVIAARWQQDLGNGFTAGQVVQLNQTNLSVMCLTDSNNKHVEATLYQYDLTAGTITFATPLDLSAYQLPLIARYAKEKENKITETDLDGTLTLEFPIGEDFDKANTFVSSALIGGDLQVRTSKPFAQQNWNNVWSDERQTNSVLAKLDTRNHPMVLTDDGTMTERWLIRFKNGTQFELFGETLGLVAKGDMLTDLAPLNPSTNKPYFTIPKQAFGDANNSGWSTGYCIRFNTFATKMEAWLARVVQPSADPQINDDGYALMMRADTVSV